MHYIYIYINIYIYIYIYISGAYSHVNSDIQIDGLDYRVQ